TLGVAYQADFFTVSGDNPNSLSFNVGIPLPVFDRNQGGIGHASVDLRAAENERDRLDLSVRHDVSDALCRIESAHAQSKLLADEVAPRAESTLAAAEKLFRAGQTSMIEYLEAQRTYVEVRRDAAQALFNYRQAAIDIAYAIGTNP